MEKQNNAERIERYLAGLMNPDEEKAFMDDLKSDKALRQEAQMTAMMVSEMRERQKRIDKDIIDEVESHQRRVAAVQHRPWRKWVAWGGAIAAMFVLFFGIRFNTANSPDDRTKDAKGVVADAVVEPSPHVQYAADSVEEPMRQDGAVNPEILFNKYYSEPQLLASRGGDDMKIKKELLGLYHRVGSERHLAPVIARLKTIYDNTLADAKGYEEYRYYENNIAWYLALAYVKNHQPEKAVPLLQTLARGGNDEAASLLRLLK